MTSRDWKSDGPPSEALPAAMQWNFPVKQIKERTQDGLTVRIVLPVRNVS